MKVKVQDLDEIKNLSKRERDLVLIEYRKAYHFLLFYGKLFGLPILILSMGYAVNLAKHIEWPFRLLIICVLSYFVSLMVKILEVNVIAKFAIRDLINDIRSKGKSTL
jgi:hypothetical protein